MPTINLENLIRYDSKAKNEAEEEYLPKDSGNWQKTEKAGAVSFYPVGNSPLEGTVDFIFSEVPPASGDKGPENPSTVMGVSSVNVGRVEKNLLLKVASTQTAATVTMTPQSDGSYIFNGTASSNESFAVTDSGVTYANPVYSSVCLDVNKQYILTAKILSGTFSGNANISLGYLDGTGQNKSASFTDGIASDTFDSSYFPDGRFLARFRVYSGASFSNAKIVFQLEEGDTATDFEAPMLPADANFTIDLGNTYYGGSIDLSTGLMTVTHICDTFTRCSGSWFYGGFSQTAETLSFQVGGSRAHLVTDGTLVSNMFIPGNSDNGVNKIAIRGSESSNVFKCSIVKSALDLSGVADPASLTQEEAIAVVDAFLSQNPLKVVYNPTTPETIQLSPTSISSLAQTDKCMPRLNTVYTDAEAIQVGYMKSPKRTEQEITQALLELESS